MRVSTMSCHPQYGLVVERRAEEEVLTSLQIPKDPYPLQSPSTPARTPVDRLWECPSAPKGRSRGGVVICLEGLLSPDHESLRGSMLSSAESPTLSVVSRETRTGPKEGGEGELTCFVIDSSIWKSVSSPRDLMPCSRAVAMFICVSSVCLRAVNSGRAVIAALRFAAFDERSLSTRHRQSFEIPTR